MAFPPEEITRKEPLPLPPPVTAPSVWPRVLKWVTVSIAVLGVVVETLHQVGALFPGSGWAGKALVVAGVLGRVALPFLVKLQLLLNSDIIDAGAKAAPKLAPDEVAKKLGKP